MCHRQGAHAVAGRALSRYTRGCTANTLLLSMDVSEPPRVVCRDPFKRRYVTTFASPACPCLKVLPLALGELEPLSTFYPFQSHKHARRHARQATRKMQLWAKRSVPL